MKINYCKHNIKLLYLLKMSYKKYILEKYKSNHNVAPLYHEIKLLQYMINDIISEKNTLEIQNSLLRYQKFKLIKEKQNLEDKLEKKLELELELELENDLHQNINYNQMHWEVFEELEFSVWLYDKKNKRKSCDDHQYIKKQKKNKNDENDENDENDDTETEDELLII